MKTFIRQCAFALAPVVLLACGGTPTGNNPDGGSTGKVTVTSLPVASGSRAHAPRFSKDGKKIAYVRQESQTYTVAVMTAAGADSKDVGFGATYLSAITWSKDDSQLYFTGSNLMVVPATGGDPVKVIEAFASLDPDLSPDGKQLAYGVNGSYMELVDLSVTPATKKALSVKGSSPRFSPDGKELAFQSENKLMRMEVTGATPTEIIDANNFFASVAWFKDGKHLVAGTSEGIELVDLTVTPPTRKLLSDEPAVMHVDLAPDEKTIVYEVNGQAQLQTLTGF